MLMLGLKGLIVLEAGGGGGLGFDHLRCFFIACIYS